MGVALLVTVVFAIPIGVLAAVKQYSLADKIITDAGDDRLRDPVVHASASSSCSSVASSSRIPQLTATVPAVR